MSLLGGLGIRFRLRGLERLQAANLKLLKAISPRGGLGKGVKAATLHLHKYAIAITHVQTGTLKRSHIMDFASGGVQTYRFGIPIVSKAVGRIYISPAARNPVTGQRPAEYGLVEHSKRGSHAFYKRTVDEQGKAAGALALVEIWSMLPRRGFTIGWR
jgi:hypothetical protein